LEQVIGEGQADLVGEFLAEGIELHGTGLAPGLPAVAQWVAAMTAAFPDRKLTINDVVAEGDKGTVRTTLTGTHRGELQGIPATGKPVRQPSITVFSLTNGKIVEAWYVSDHLSLMQQLGVIPTAQEN